MKLADITVSRLIAASAERVFDVWMDPESPGVPDDEMGHRHREGWTGILSTLADRFASHSYAPASGGHS